jgi:hypothetical protein
MNATVGLYTEFRNQIAEDVGAVISKFTATSEVDSTAIRKLRDHCFDTRRRLSEQAIDLRLAVCEVAGAAGKSLADRNIGQLSDALAKLDRAIERRHRL